MESRSEYNIKGIDISSYQSGVDFDKVKNSGYNAVIIKATEGVNYIDTSLDTHYNNALRSGMDIGFYHFMSEKTSPASQAIDFWNAISNKNFNMVPVLDIETNTLGRSKTSVTNRCIEFLNQFKALSSMDCVIYSYTNFITNYLDTRLVGYKLWVANYYVNTPYANPVWNSWEGFQYSDKGKVNGVIGYVDVNEFRSGMYLGGTSRTNSIDNWVSKLQKQINIQGFGNLAVDGIAGPKTLAGAPMIRIGARGEITRLIQEKLNITADGIFGVNTKTAVQNYQLSNGLVPDGIVGKNTWTKLLGLI